MTPSQRLLALALVLGAYFSSTGNPHAQPSHFLTQFFAHAKARATNVAAQLETKAANLLTICSPHFGGCDVLPGALERFGIPMELVREGE